MSCNKKCLITSLALLAFLYLWGCNAGKYNFKNIFVLNEGLWARANKINGADAFMIQLKKSEFESLKQIIIKQGFDKWQPLAGTNIYSGKLKFSETLHDKNETNSIFSINKKAKLDGVFPIFIYYPDKRLLYMIIADSLI